MSPRICACGHVSHAHRPDGCAACACPTFTTPPRGLGLKDLDPNYPPTPEESAVPTPKLPTLDCPRCGRALAMVEWDERTGTARILEDRVATVAGTHHCPKDPEENPMPDRAPDDRPAAERLPDATVVALLSEWLCHPSEDGQWRSAADFIEYAADLVRRTGRPTDPAKPAPRYVLEELPGEVAGVPVVVWALCDTAPAGIDADGKEHPPEVLNVYLRQATAAQFLQELNG